MTLIEALVNALRGCVDELELHEKHAIATGDTELVARLASANTALAAYNAAAKTSDGLIIVLQGGVLQAVITNMEPAPSIAVVEYDDEDDLEDPVSIPQSDGGTEEANAFFVTPEHDPAWLQSTIAAITAHHQSDQTH
jgi:hypothetical protein